MFTLDSLAARENDLSEFVYKKIFFNTNPTTFPPSSSFLYNNMKKSCLMEDDKQLLLYI